jgi:hypothetical protein
VAARLLSLGPSKCLIFISTASMRKDDKHSKDYSIDHGGNEIKVKCEVVVLQFLQLDCYQRNTVARKS